MRLATTTAKSFLQSPPSGSFVVEGIERIPLNAIGEIAFRLQRINADLARRLEGTIRDGWRRIKRLSLAGTAAGVMVAGVLAALLSCRLGRKLCETAVALDAAAKRGSLRQTSQASAATGDPGDASTPQTGFSKGTDPSPRPAAACG